MSVWDDSWGYLWTTSARSWESGVKIGAAKDEGPSACDAQPLSTTPEPLRAIKEVG